MAILESALGGTHPWWVLVLVGVVAGVISGALGVGSGIVLVPVMVTVFLLPQKSAQGTALAVMVPMALLGALRYWHNPEIDVNMPVVAFLVLGALPGVLAGTELAARLPAHWLRKAFAILMVIVAIKMFSMPSRRTAAPSGSPDGATRSAVETKGPGDG
jgi:uncharacterized membrane protein YfcA